MKFSDKKLLELYRQGLTNKEIADELGVTPAAVRYRLQKLGQKNNCHEEKSTNFQQVKILHIPVLTAVGIALILQTNVQTVSKLLKQLGLKDNYWVLTEIAGGQGITE
ncbi:MAG: AsnC family protein [Candidatus Methanofastidiosia archaeon]|jgi:DNA-binding CsgD family transcriptional regulator